MAATLRRKEKRKCSLLLLFVVLMIALAICMYFELRILGNSELSKQTEQAAQAKPSPSQQDVFPPERASEHRRVDSRPTHRCIDAANQPLDLTIAPQLIIAGAQKAGTSAMRSVLAQHPSIVASTTWEPHFFDEKLFRYLKRNFNHTAKSSLREEWLCDIRKKYISIFHPEMRARQTNSSSADTDFFFFEKTPSYLLHPSVPRLIEQVCPWKPKILVMLRDPIDRAYSHYLMEKEKLRVNNQTFQALIHQEINLMRVLGLSNAPPPPLSDTLSSTLLPNNNNRWTFDIPSFSTSDQSDRAHTLLIQNMTYTNFIQRGMYSVQLARWIKHFSLQESLMVVTYEQFRQNPTAIYQRVLSFLRVPNPDIVQSSDFDKNYHTRGVYRKQGMIHEPMRNDTRTYLQQFFKPYNEELAMLLGEEPWKGIWMS